MRDHAKPLCLQYGRMATFLELVFQLRQHQSSIRIEVLGGVTTFATMAYIIVVNPAILQHAGIPTGPSTVATILTAAVGCLLMGFYANRPIAVAPYMGENAFLAFGLFAFVDLTWQLRLGTVFIAGAAFLVLTLLGIRGWLAAAISDSLKHSFAVGIGLFLLLIGLYQTGIVTSGAEGLPAVAPNVRGDVIGKPAVPVKLGNLRDPQVQFACAGFVGMAVLLYWRVKGGILIGIVVIAVVGILLGYGTSPQAVVAAPWNYHLEEIGLQLDVKGVFFAADGSFRITFLPIVLTLLLISFLDTLATLVALNASAQPPPSPPGTPGGEGRGEEGTTSHEEPPHPNPLPLSTGGEGTSSVRLDKDLKKPMLVDSLACMFAALVGTSTSGAYIESATGIREGARTGLAAVITGLLFALALFFIPLVAPMQTLVFAYGPALMIVGLLMFAMVRHVAFDDLTELVPSLATIVMMVFTFNIANGLTAGLILHPVMKLATGRWGELHPGGVILGILCAAYYVFGLPH